MYCRKANMLNFCTPRLASRMYLNRPCCPLSDISGLDVDSRGRNFVEVISDSRKAMPRQERYHNSCVFRC